MILLDPFLFVIETGGRFQSPYVPSIATHIGAVMRAVSLDEMGLGEDNCPSLWLVDLLCHI
jgi:hypothetical protein